MKALKDTKLMQYRILRAPLSWVYWTYRRLIARHLPDIPYLKWRHFCIFHRFPDLSNPKFFNEKLHWLKLHDRKPVYHTMVDKYDVKQFIAERYSGDILIPTLGIWDNFDDIDFASLPDNFILKGTFDSGSYYICRGKENLNVEEARKSLLQNWNDNYYMWSREWPYDGLKHRIIAEPLIAEKKDLWEFKFFCFEGEPKFYQSCLDRERAQASLLFYDVQGNPIPIRDKYHTKNTDERVVKPQHLDEMLNICRIFSAETHFLRVDLYEIHGKIYFGEFTFFENGGWCEFVPEEYNRILGDWIKVP